MKSKLIKATANRPFITIVFIVQQKLLPKNNSDLTPPTNTDEEYTIEDLIHDTHQIIKYRYTEVLVLPTYRTQTK